jgi:branched-chain amino acid transport system substrate-binding protein
MKKSTIWAWAVIVIIIIILIIWGISKPSAPQQSIKIGADFAISGYGAEWAENDKDGASLAVKEINAQGGVLGRLLELDLQDNQSSPTGSVQAANKLINQEGVKFILTGWAEHTESILSLLDQNKTIGVGVSTGDPTVTEKSQWFFNVWPRDSFLSRASVDYMNQKGFKKVAIFNTIGPWENGVVATIKSQFASSSMSVIDQESVNPTATDYKTQIAKIKTLSPDVVYIQSLEPNAGIFIKQARDLGLKVPFVYATSMDPAIVTAAGGMGVLEGTVYPIYKAPADSFQKSFSSEYNRQPGVSADTAYDAVYVLAQAIKNAGSDDVEKVKAELAKTKDFAGASGTITFDETRNRGGAEVIMMMVKEGKFVPVN